LRELVRETFLGDKASYSKAFNALKINPRCRTKKPHCTPLMNLHEHQLLKVPQDFNAKISKQTPTFEDIHEEKKKEQRAQVTLATPWYHDVSYAAHKK